MIPRMTMPVDQTRNWRPRIRGGDWSDEPMAFYAAVVPTLPRFPWVAEIGVAFGRSLLFAAELLTRRQPGILFGIDPWQGQAHPDADKRSPCSYAEALASIVDGAQPGELEITYLLRMESKKARRCFGDWPVFHLVFIDGDHSYQGACDDIRAWRGLVEPGGILAGHDYAERFPGVVRAVDEAFPRGVDVQGTCWAVQI
jgi:hypothetical protein